MKKTIHFILIITFIHSMFAFGQTDIPEQFCDNSFTSKRLLSNWRLEKGKREEYCAEVECTGPEGDVKRKRCFFQREEHPNTILMSQEDNIRTDKLASYKSRLFEHVLMVGDTCFEECRPAAKTFMGIKRKDVHGLDRESCLACFTKRKDLSFDDSYEYPEIGRRLYYGEKCHYMCKDKPGQFSFEKRVLTEECKQCIGMKFEYLLTKSSACYEVDSERGMRPVPKSFCAPSADLIMTHYAEGSIYSLKTIFFKVKPDCYELDDQTNGAIFKIVVDRAYCDSKGITNSDREEGKNIKSTGDNSKNKSSRASQQ